MTAAGCGVDRRLAPTPLGADGVPLPARPAWREAVARAADPERAARRVWDGAERTPLTGRRRRVAGVDLVEASFLTWAPGPAEVLVHVNSLTDNVRRAFEPWLARSASGTPLRSVDVLLPADGTYSYRLVAAVAIARDAGHTRSGWSWVHRHGRPDPRNPERIVDPLGSWSSIWRGPRAPRPLDARRRAEPAWEAFACRTPDGTSRTVHGRRGAGRGPVVVLFDGEQWRTDGVAGWLGTPGVAHLDVVLVDAMSRERRWEDLTSPAWGAQVRAILDAVGRRWSRPVRREDVVLAGQSLGGLAAAELAVGPDRVADRAVCQSGSYWWDPAGGGRGEGPGLLVRELRAGRDARGSRLVVQVGADEADMVGLSRELSAAARAAGAHVDHVEYRGGHDYAWWAPALVAGLATLGPGLTAAASRRRRSESTR